MQGAYDVLSDPQKRKQYDAFGSADGRGPRAGNFNFGEGGINLGDLSDLFGGLGDVFGGGGTRAQQQRPGRGADLETEVRLSFEDSLRGIETRIPVEVEAACRECGGAGTADGSPPKVCPECKGRGATVESQGFFGISQPCRRCGGQGTIVENPCRRCDGSGRERRTKQYAVKIPAGAKDGTRIRLKGKGEPGYNGGPPGDLYVVTRVADSPLYERRGADLVVDVPITFADAALGSEVEVPTPEGAVSLKVPAGTESGKLLRIKGRGAPKLQGSGRGDVLARVKIAVPKKPNKKERELLKELQKVQRANVMDDRPRYMISVAADLVGMHPQTLRIYEAKGLVQPQRTAGNTRLYSEADLERLRLINQLTTELGLNLAGVEHVIRLEEQLRRMQRRMERLELEMRERLEEVRRSYSADLVPYDPDATRLPIRRTWTSTG